MQVAPGILGDMGDLSFWSGVGLGVLGSVLVGVLLWMVLPRGVVLTKKWTEQYGTGAAVPETFTITNNSPHVAKILGVDGPGLGTGTMWEPHPNPLDLDEYSGMTLTFDDYGLDIARQEQVPSWEGLTIPPGETMTATLGGIMGLRIRYCRSGWFGRLERKELKITHLS